jgi:signal transduction histidine kinase
MKYPEFIEEMRAPGNRAKLRFGIYSGYYIAAGFSILAAASAVFQLSLWRRAFLYLVLVKIVTNSLAWWSLHKRVFILETQGLNTFGDVVLMTAAIYLTGGAVSPLLPIYVINIVVLALLSNFGVTVMFAVLTLVLYSVMVILVGVGVLPPMPVVGSTAEMSSIGLVATAIGYCAFVVGIPTAFTTATLRLLRGKEQALEQRTAELIEAGTQRSQFVASLTHELRTPIHGVGGLAALLGQGVYGQVNDKQRDVCDKIGRSANTLLGLVDDLLNLARADAGKLEVRVDKLDVAALIDNVATSVSWMMTAKQQELVVSASPGMSLQSDPRWLAHILVNLVANAAKFTAQEGRIVISAKATDVGCEFCVRDNGIGISATDQQTIFEPFRQVDGGDARGFGGVGLGLALVARLSAMLGAQVSLQSALGQGSAFTVAVPHLPVAQHDPVAVVSLPHSLT